MIFIKKCYSITILSKHGLKSCYFSQKERKTKRKKEKKKAFLLVRYLIKQTYRLPHELFTARKLLACRNSLVMLFYRSDFKNFHLWSRFHKHRIVRVVLTSQFHLNCITDQEAVHQRTYCK